MKAVGAGTGFRVLHSGHWRVEDWRMKPTNSGVGCMWKYYSVQWSHTASTVGTRQTGERWHTCHTQMRVKLQGNVGQQWIWQPCHCLAHHKGTEIWVQWVRPAQTMALSLILHPSVLEPDLQLHRGKKIISRRMK